MTCNFVDEGLNVSSNEKKEVSMVKKRNWKIDSSNNNFVPFLIEPHVKLDF